MTWFSSPLRADARCTPRRFALTRAQVRGVRRRGGRAIGGRSAAVIVVTIIVVVLFALGVMASTASADQMTVFSCHDPAGNAVGDYGWGQERFVNGLGGVLEDTCAGSGAGALVAYIGGQTSGYANLERVQWTFSAPPWATITHYALRLPESYTYPSHGAGEGQAFVNASDESDPDYDYRALGTGSLGAASVERTPPDEVRSVTVNASCDGFLGPCPGDTFISRIEVSQATFVLSDSTLPSVKSVGGSLLSGGPAAGVVEARFVALDSGPGIYSAHLVVDGVPQPAVALDNNDGLCQNLGQTSNGTRSFASPEPCAKNVEGAVTLDTSRFTNGAHHVQLFVEDAAGNQVSAFDGTVMFENTLPSPIGPGNPPGLGAPNGSGASEGASLRLAAGASVTRTYARRSLTLRGHLVGAQGQPIEDATLDVLQQPVDGGQGVVIAHALTGTGGSFSAKVPSGPPRIVEVAYRAFTEDPAYAAHAQISEYVDAGARLNVSPLSTSPTGTIVLSGRVLGAIPAHGVLAELLVHYRGRWEPFRTPRTDSSGRFRVVYQFEGAIGSFPFRVKVPGEQAGFAFATGYSASVSVSTQ